MPSLTVEIVYLCSKKIWRGHNRGGRGWLDEEKGSGSVDERGAAGLPSLQVTKGGGRRLRLRVGVRLDERTSLWVWLHLPPKGATEMLTWA